MNEPISTKTVAVLRDPVFDLPKARPRGDVATFLEQIYAAFFDRLGELDEPLASVVYDRRNDLVALSKVMVEVCHIGEKGDASEAYALLDAGLRSVSKELMAMSRRHSKRVLKGQSWYRLAAWKGAESRAHMFHAPFELPQNSYRFSTPGHPSIYLSNSVYLCWLECGKPPVGDCVVSRFEVDSAGFDFLDLPCSHQAYVDPLDFLPLPGLEVDPRTVTNSPYLEEVVLELADYLSVWPLLAAVSVRKLEPAPPKPPEYTVPQLLMRWVRDSDALLGIRFFTSKNDPSTNSQDWSVNLALPTRTNKDSGYCDFLLARARCTQPQPLSSMESKSLRELVTKEAGDRRQSRSGRNKILTEDRGLEEYIETVYGKMEYWLDRPEIEVASIQSP